MWFVSLACIAVSIGIFHGIEYAFLFFGVTTIISLVFYYISETA
jgi:hypothetical protein